MTIKDAVLEGCIITCRYRQLYYNSRHSKWVVIEEDKNEVDETKVIIETTNESEAVSELLKG